MSLSDANRLQLAYVEETTLGTTPAITGTTVMRLGRVTGESIGFNITNITSNELRSDRNVPDLIQSAAQNGGSLPFEFSYPFQRGFFDQMLGGAMFANWTNAPYKNNITADTEVANVATSGVYTVDAGGATFLVGMLVRATGFTNAGNNTTTGAAKVSANTGTTVTMSGGGLTTVLETVPPVGATLQVVGFQGASADITATASGLGSTVLDFTTLPLKIGQWIKVGGSAAGEKFATAALNDWIRITAIAATALTCDNLPTGWTTDAGTGKTIDIWFGDNLKNGIVKRSFTIEKGFLDIAQYLVHTGMIVQGVQLNLQAQQIVTGQFDFLGLNTSASASPLAATPTSAGSEAVLNAMASVGRIAENGLALTTTFAQSLQLQIQNNPRPQAAIGQVGLVGVGVGRCDVSGTATFYFSDRTQYDKYIAGTATSVNFRQIDATGKRAFIASLPKVKFESGQVQAKQINTDVLATLGFRAVYDSVTASEVSFDRFAYYE